MIRFTRAALCLLSYTGIMVRSAGLEPASRAWHARILATGRTQHIEEILIVKEQKNIGRGTVNRTPDFLIRRTLLTLKARYLPTGLYPENLYA